MNSPQKRKKTDGLVRIVMIKSGQADYVEIEPHSSVHLVGDNGIGKSMILATIQFLMIDDWNRGKMKLSNGALKHKEFYFPTAKSLVIFELESPEGVRHLYVIRGLGKTNNFEIEKWAAEGCWYNENIFIEHESGESKIRSWDGIRDNLLKEASSLHKISNKQERIRLLKNWMGWFGKSNLGEDFSDLYLKFLKLGSIKEVELKKHIITSAVPENMTTQIDISEDYARTWREIVDERENLKSIKSMETKLKQLVQKYDDLAIRKTQLTQRWVNLENLTSIWAEEAETSATKLKQEKGEIGIILENKKERLKHIIQENKKFESDKKLKTYQIEELKKVESFVESFNPENAKELFEQLESEYSDLSSRIGSVEKHTEESIIRNIKRCKTEFEKYERLVNETSITLIGSLENSDIPIPEIVDAFRILDSDLLYSRGSIEDKKTAMDWLKELANSIDGKTAILNGIKMEVGDKRTLNLSIEEAKVQLEQAETELAEWNAIRDDYSDKKPLLSMRVKIRQQSSALELDIKKYDSWNDSEKEKLKKLRNEVNELEEFLNKLSDEEEEIDRILIDVRAKSSTIEKQLEELQNIDDILENYREISNLLGIDSIPSSENIDFDLTEIAGKIGQLYRDCNDYSKDDTDFDKAFSRIQYELKSSISGIDRTDFIEEARERLDGLETMQENVQNLWFELSNNISGTADDLMKSLREVERKVRTIDSDLKKKKITNIEEIHLEIDRNDTKVKSIIKAASGNALLNFVSKEHRTHFNEMNKLFEEKPRIELHELFNLDLFIKKPGDEQKRKIGSIDRSGSEGQITAIKSHLLMILLSEILGKERSRIPIFLDETGKLGSTNYKQILDMASEVGIQIMTASPAPVEYAEIQHAIVGYGSENRLRIRPKQYWSSISDEEEK
jgi:DNA repair exonuclease SbcCD ATPase subunit